MIALMGRRRRDALSDDIGPCANTGHDVTPRALCDFTGHCMTIQGVILQDKFKLLNSKAQRKNDDSTANKTY